MADDPDVDRLMTLPIPAALETVWIFRAFEPPYEVRAFREEEVARWYATEHGGKLNQVRVE